MKYLFKLIAITLLLVNIKPIHADNKAWRSVYESWTLERLDDFEKNNYIQYYNGGWADKLRAEQKQELNTIAKQPFTHNLEINGNKVFGGTLFAPSDYHISLLGQIQDLSNQNKGINVLNIGCGFGGPWVEGLLFALSNLPNKNKITFLDIDKKVIERLKINFSKIKSIDKNQLIVKVITSNFIETPFSDKFDVIIHSNVAHFLSDSQINKHMSAIRSLLKQNGLFYIETNSVFAQNIWPSCNNDCFHGLSAKKPRTGNILFQCKVPTQDGVHHYLYDHHGLSSLLNFYNLDIASIGYQISVSAIIDGARVNLGLKAIDAEMAPKECVKESHRLGKIYALSTYSYAPDENEDL